MLTWRTSKFFEGEEATGASGIKYKIKVLRASPQAAGSRFAYADQEQLGIFNLTDEGQEQAKDACQRIEDAWGSDG